MGLRFLVAKILRNGYFAGHVNYDNVEDGGTLDNVVSVGNLTNKSWTIAGQPDVPRNVVLTVVDTTPGITAGTVTVTGVGAYGQTLVETFNCAAGAGTYTGNCAFATIATIVTSAFATLGGGGDESCHPSPPLFFSSASAAVPASAAVHRHHELLPVGLLDAQRAVHQQRQHRLVAGQDADVALRGLGHDGLGLPRPERTLRRDHGHVQDLVALSHRQLFASAAAFFSTSSMPPAMKNACSGRWS